MQINSYFQFQLLIFLMFVCQAAISVAATDGNLDTTSTGDTSVSLAVDNLVRISAVTDLNLGTYEGVGALSDDANVCIWTNQANGNYKVTAQGDGVNNAFTVSGPASSLIAYTVRWNNTNGTSGNVALSADTQSSAFSGASTSSSTCSGGTNANFQVTFTEVALLASPPGIYTGVLTLIIAPG